MRRRRIVNHDPLIQYAQAAREQLLVTAIRLRVQVENLRGVIKESERRLGRVVERLETVNTQANETGTIVCLSAYRRRTHSAECLSVFL